MGILMVVLIWYLAMVVFTGGGLTSDRLED